MNVKFHKNYENTGKLLKISCVRCNFVKFFVVLLQITNYIFSPLKMQKIMQYALNYSGTRFLSTDN